MQGHSFLFLFIPFLFILFRFFSFSPSLFPFLYSFIFFIYLSLSLFLYLFITLTHTHTLSHLSLLSYSGLTRVSTQVPAIPYLTTPLSYRPTIRHPPSALVMPDLIRHPIFIKSAPFNTGFPSVHARKWVPFVS